MTRNQTRLAWAAAVAVVVVVVAVSGIVYAYGARDKRCGEDFESAALSVSGVITADFTCETEFEGSLQWGTVTLDAETEEDAVALMESVLRAYTEKPGIRSAWGPSVDYVSENGTISVSPADAGLNGGSPPLYAIREHYGL
ncbi:hypothetical protein [Streptomyces sp. 2A115]|uniref:hypothetical protein n=1 Tax=Streptomyces sp. 2A115 TaxID=3457439 RepID=UPI003FD09768